MDDHMPLTEFCDFLRELGYIHIVATDVNGYEMRYYYSKNGLPLIVHTIQTRKDEVDPHYDVFVLSTTNQKSSVLKQLVLEYNEKTA